MDKRTLIAVVLSVGILFGYPYFMRYINPSPPQVAQKTERVETAQEAVSSGAGTEAQAPKSASEKAVEEKLTAVETPLFKAVYTNKGAGVKSFVLKKYGESIQKDAPGVNLAASIAIKDSYRVRLVSNGAYEDLVFSLPKPATVSDGETAELVFTAKSASGLTVEKKLTVSGDNYVVKTGLNIINTTKKTFQGSIETMLAANVSGKDDSHYHQGPIIRTEKDLDRQTEKQPELSGGELKWIGLESKYFLSALIPVTEVPTKWKSLVASETDSSASLSVPLNMPPSTATTFTYNSFLGPKVYDLLLKQRLGLDESIEFGYFSFMAKPTLVALNFFEKYLGNYGIAIILITILIKIAFYPLSRHSLKSMKDMQKLQPQLAAIKEKYKDNKEKMNKELMEMYKRYKVNPVGGCLPMILQIPVFIALYEVLYVAIELRHAPFFFWLQDLSAKDPFYITPLVMGATMFIQQKMTPSAMDPSQAKIMLFMPVIFTFMFLSFPSGLVLYWLVNNVLTIAQQYYIQRSPSTVKA